MNSQIVDDFISDFDFDFELLEDVEGLSHWEFVNTSDGILERLSSDTEDGEVSDNAVLEGLSNDTEDEEESDNAVVERLSTDTKDEEESDYVNDGVVTVSNLQTLLLPVIPVPIPHRDQCFINYDSGRADSNTSNYYDGNLDAEKEEEEEEEEEGGGDEYDLDDELVPWSVSSKFQRQRIRKLGKRGFQKMNNSKRSPYLFVRPGCVHGKHGLGLKHNY